MTEERALSYKDLEVYKLAHSLAVSIHRMSLHALPAFEKFEEGCQIRRSSKSISTNIVEGFGRRKYKADFIRFLVYSHASCDETLEHLLYLQDTGSLDQKAAGEFIQKTVMLGKKLHSFLIAVELHHNGR